MPLRGGPDVVSSSEDMPRSSRAPCTPVAIGGGGSSAGGGVTAARAADDGGAPGAGLHGAARSVASCTSSPCATPDSCGSVAGSGGRAAALPRRPRRVRLGGGTGWPVVWSPVTRPPCAAMSACSIVFAPAMSFSCSMLSASSREPRTASARGSAPRPWCRGARGGVSAAGAVPASSITAWTGGSLYRGELGEL